MNTGRNLMRIAALMAGCILGVFVTPGWDWIDAVLLVGCVLAAVCGYIVIRIDRKGGRDV